MHACGHDIHMAAWIAVARILVDMKDKWSGTLMFVGQPAEEPGAAPHGWLPMGLFKRFPKPDFGFALHVGPEPPWLRQSTSPASSTRPSDSFLITFNGKGGHGSRPHTTIDPVMMAGPLHRRRAERGEPREEFGALRRRLRELGHAGNAGNVIPNSATLRGTIRSYDDRPAPG